ncbi:uncharacterized protein LOC124271595 [Haliotis rubra]|uniref:uncharacterized protein LOC124271595 n=1 Tax=Haliotis rubra TaxID=36100 RepID=UPI001EE51F84|nr:uncharacterized protein LOC124271595 [Haliotis rubra]
MHLSLSPDTPMLSLLVPAVAVLWLLLVVVLVYGIRRCRSLRAKRKLRYAAHLTALNNRASSESPNATVHVEGARVSYSNMRESSATSEQHYATAHDEGARWPVPGHRSDATANDEGAILPVPSNRSDSAADYVALGQEEHVHIYTALRLKARQQVGWWEKED